MSSLFSISRPATLACGAALLGLGAAPPPLDQVQAQTESHAKTAGQVTYPASLDRTDLLAWMRRDTDIAPESVVAISPLAIIAIMQTQPVSAPQGFEVTVRAEIIDATFVRDEHLLSWHATIKLDCAGRKVAVGEATGHGDRNLLGDGHPVQIATLGWRPVVAESMQGQIWAARCDKSFVPPLADEAAAASGPITTSPESPRRPAPAAAAKTPPAPVAAPPPPALRMTPQPSTNVPARSPAPPPSRPPAPASPGAPAVSGSVQILASPVAAEAQHALAALRAKLPDAMAGLRTEVVPVQTGTTVRHRAIVSGFKAPGDATRFCRQLTAAGGACFVRGDAGRAPSEHAPQP